MCAQEEKSGRVKLKDRQSSRERRPRDFPVAVSAGHRSALLQSSAKEPRLRKSATTGGGFEAFLRGNFTQAVGKNREVTFLQIDLICQSTGARGIVDRWLWHCRLLAVAGRANDMAVWVGVARTDVEAVNVRRGLGEHHVEVAAAGGVALQRLANFIFS